MSDFYRAYDEWEKFRRELEKDQRDRRALTLNRLERLAERHSLTDPVRSKALYAAMKDQLPFKPQVQAQVSDYWSGEDHKYANAAWQVFK